MNTSWPWNQFFSHSHLLTWKKVYPHNKGQYIDSLACIYSSPKWENRWKKEHECKSRWCNKKEIVSESHFYCILLHTHYSLGLLYVCILYIKERVGPLLLIWFSAGAGKQMEADCEWELEIDLSIYYIKKESVEKKVLSPSNSLSHFPLLCISHSNSNSFTMRVSKNTVLIHIWGVVLVIPLFEGFAISTNRSQ